MSNFRTIVFAGAVLASAPALALVGYAHADSTEILLKRWYTWEAYCRSTPPSLKLDRACREWPIVGKQLEALGYCFTGTFGANMHWEYTHTPAICKQVQDRNALDAQHQIDPK